MKNNKYLKTLKMNPAERQRNMSRLRLLTFCMFTAGLAGCVSPIAVDPGFRQSRNAKVAVVTMEAPKATVMQQGSQGILDAVINQAVASGARKRLEDYPSQARLDAVGARFAKRLSGLGYKATFVGVHPSRKDFNSYMFKPSATKPLPGRDTYLKGYDTALFVDMPAVGQVQLVYGFIPLSGRKATASLLGAMYSKSDGKCVWRSRFLPPNFMEGKSTEGPSSDMANVYRAIDQAVEAQAQALEQDFFMGF